MYYQTGLGRHWYWDNNEYDLLTERSATNLEVIYLKYHDVFYNRTEKKDAPKTQFSVYNLKNCNYNKTQNVQATLSMERTEEKTWTHSFQLGLSSSQTVSVSAKTAAQMSGLYCIIYKQRGPAVGWDIQEESLNFV